MVTLITLETSSIEFSAPIDNSACQHSCVLRSQFLAASIMQFITLMAALFAAIAVANPIPLPSPEAVSNVEVRKPADTD